MRESGDAAERLRRIIDEIRAVFQSFPDFLFRLSLSGEVLEFLGGPLTEFNISPEDFLGRRMHEVLPEDVAALVERAIAETTESGRPATIEYPLPLNDQERFFESKVTRFMDDEILVVSRDITERKRTETALKRSEEKWRSLTESAEDLIVSVDREGRVLAANRTLSGIPVENAVGLFVYDFLAPQCHDNARRALQSVFESKQRGRFEVLAIGPVTNGLYFDVRVGPIIEKDQVVAATWIARDITHRKQMEAALRESEEKFRSLMDTMPAAAFIYDGTHLLYVNATAEALTGYNEEELLSVDPWELIDAEFRESLPEQWEAYQRGETDRVRDEVKLATKDRVERWVDFSVGRFEFRGATVAMGTAFEITERKQAEEALEQLREELEDKAERHLTSGNRYGLTFRELTVLGLAATGTPDKAIAKVLGISTHTVNKHLANILRKMDASSRTEAGVRALREHLID